MYILSFLDGLSHTRAQAVCRELRKAGTVPESISLGMKRKKVRLYLDDKLQSLVLKDYLYVPESIFLLNNHTANWMVPKLRHLEIRLLDVAMTIDLLRAVQGSLESLTMTLCYSTDGAVTNEVVGGVARKHHHNSGVTDVLTAVNKCTKLRELHLRGCNKWYVIELFKMPLEVLSFDGSSRDVDYLPAHPNDRYAPESTTEISIPWTMHRLHSLTLRNFKGHQQLSRGIFCCHKMTDLTLGKFSGVEADYLKNVPSLRSLRTFTLVDEANVGNVDLEHLLSHTLDSQSDFTISIDALYVGLLRKAFKRITVDDIGTEQEKRMAYISELLGGGHRAIHWKYWGNPKTGWPFSFKEIATVLKSVPTRSGHSDYKVSYQRHDTWTLIISFMRCLCRHAPSTVCHCGASNGKYLDMYADMHFGDQITVLENGKIEVFEDPSNNERYWI